MILIKMLGCKARIVNAMEEDEHLGPWVLELLESGATMSGVVRLIGGHICVRMEGTSWLD